MVTGMDSRGAVVDELNIPGQKGTPLSSRKGQELYFKSVQEIDYRMDVSSI
jgi:hypothetical protein